MHNRTNVYFSFDPEAGPKALAGYFDHDKAGYWTDRDHNGNGSGGTGRGEAVYRTAQGRWVLERWTRWQGEANRCVFITPEGACEWLLRNYEDQAVTRYFGELDDERGPGRPKIGGILPVRLGDDLLAHLETYAAEQGKGRAEVIRELLAEALIAARPIRDAEAADPVLAPLLVLQAVLEQAEGWRYPLPEVADRAVRVVLAQIAGSTESPAEAPVSKDPS
jgi:hypothetical protein